MYHESGMSKPSLQEMNESNALLIEMRNRRCLIEAFGSDLGTRLDRMSGATVRNLCQSLSYFGECCRVFNCADDDPMKPQRQSSLRYELEYILDRHPQCGDLFDIVASCMCEGSLGPGYVIDRLCPSDPLIRVGQLRADDVQAVIGT